MITVISASEPFSNISWWARVSTAENICFDHAEHFRKMSFRNRYYITGASGRLLLTIPLVHGRNQRTPMADVRICNKERWQVQHWRTIIAAYRRAPFFEYYSEDLKAVFETRQEWLVDFNALSFAWLNKHIKLPVTQTVTKKFLDSYDHPIIDLRFRPKSMLSGDRVGVQPDHTGHFPPYQQVFADRTGFIADLSLLDLLFAEGPYTRSWLQENRMTLLD